MTSTPISRRNLTKAVGLLAAAGGVMAAAQTAQAQTAPANESTLDRVKRTKVLRVAAIPGAAPYFQKDPASGKWTGAAVEMASDIAKPFSAELEFVESTYPNSVLDLKTSRVDLAFALNPTAERCLSITFTEPYYHPPFVFMAREGFTPRKWADANKQGMRIASILGSLSERLARRYTPLAEHTTYKNLDESVLAFQAGRADCIISAALQAISVKSRNPTFKVLAVAENPKIALRTCMGIRLEEDRGWQNYLDGWVADNRLNGQVFELIVAELAKTGVAREDVPSDI